MHIKIHDYFIKEDNHEIKITNTEDVFLQKFDITWANFDSGLSMPNSSITDKAFKHKIATKIWDRIPIENFDCDHEKCDGNIIYKYNNEYYRCDDFTKQHDGLHVLFAGCSESEGVGGTLENTWTNRVYKEISKNNELSGFYSIARSGYGWQKIISNFQIYAKKYGFPQFLFVMMPNIGRQYRYDTDKKTYSYYQLYPESYEINDQGLCTTSTSKQISSVKIYKENVILLEEYYKTLIDFKISWELFENFCRANGTNLLWSSYDNFDIVNFDRLGIGSTYFATDTGNIDNYVSNKKDLSISKDSFVYRDGHYGSLIKEYWAEMFLNEIKKRGMIQL